MKFARLILALSVSVLLSGCAAMAGMSGYSNVASVSTPTPTDTTAPSVPTGLSATPASSSQIVLNWSASTDVGGSSIVRYKVFRDGTLAGTTGLTSYTDGGLSAGVSYCYTIAAYDNFGNVSPESSQVCASITSSQPSGNNAAEEWYGPFASWDNIKTRYGAVGDGIADDTTAINNALAGVGTAGSSPVLYFPAGTYRVTQKLLLKNRQHVQILGQNPQTTILKYDGGTSDTSYSGATTLFHADGIDECHFARLTFDGNGKSRTIVSESQSPTAAFFDAGNTWEDCRFINSNAGGHGIDAGFYDYGFAGIDFVRCIFSNLTVALQTWNYNALDGWLTDCLVVNCGTGIYTPVGSVHAYHTSFVRNRTDFNTGAGTSFESLVANVSYNSGQFIKVDDSPVMPMLIKGNTIIDSTNTPISYGGLGPVVLMDNVIASANSPAFESFNNGGGQIDLLAYGNTNCVSSWFSVVAGSNLKTNFVDNAVVSRGSLNVTVPSPPTHATNLNRTVVNMSSNFTSVDLQNAINSAAEGTVIHIPWAANVNQYYAIDSTITIPTNKDVRIIGDGPRTKLVWTGAVSGKMFVLVHPSKATLGFLHMHGGSGSECSGLVEVSGVASTSARIYLRDVSMQLAKTANLRVEDCSGTVVDWYGRGGGGASLGFGAKGNGNNILLTGSGKVRYINHEGGGNGVGYVCTNGGNLYVETSYDESGQTFGNRILKVSGNSSVTFLCGKMVENGSPEGGWGRATSNGFACDNFSGNLTFALQQGLTDWFVITNSTTGNIWIQGNGTFGSPQTSTWPVLNSISDTPVQTMNWNQNGGQTRYTDVGTATAAYVRSMLAPARAEYSDRSPMVRRTNQTDVLIEHVLFELGQQNLWVKP